MAAGDDMGSIVFMPETPSLRDYFAAKALSAYIAAIAANPEAFEAEAEDMEAYVAKCAYTTADAMIAARKSAP